MRIMLMVACVAAMSLLGTGCKKEETPGQKLDSMLDSGKKQAEKASKDAEKAAGDIQKKLDKALEKK